jgi:hypothetical protein
MKKLITLAAASMLLSTAHAQVCDPNIDFETGTYSNWWFYTGTPTADGGGCCPINTPTFNGLGTPMTGRQSLMSGAYYDSCCGFAVIDSFGGAYALRVGDSTGVESKAQRAAFNIHVPSTGAYNLIYRYAVALKDPAHMPTMQPRFEFTVKDSATGTVIPALSFSYVSGPSLPGFYTVTTAPCGNVGQPIRCKAWTTESVNLSAYAGQTLTIDWATGDCGYGGHYAYAYIDMDCGLFPIMKTMHCDSTTAHLAGPNGFIGYSWHNATFTASYGSSRLQDVPVPAAGTSKTYALVVTPKAGYGHQDTMYTTLSCSNPTTTGVGNDADRRIVSIYPNPATDQISIEALPDQYVSVTIKNVTGQVVKMQNITTTHTVIQIQDLAHGIYTVELKDKHEAVITKKIVKE